MTEPSGKETIPEPPSLVNSVIRGAITVQQEDQEDGTILEGLGNSSSSDDVQRLQL
jgi:hypothetical protein